MDNNMIHENIQELAEENAFITYNNIMMINEIFVYEYEIKPNFDYYNKYLKLDIFKGMSMNACLKIILQRKVKDFIEWLGRNEKSIIKMKEEISNKFIYTHKYADLSNLGEGILNLLLNGNVKKAVIAVDHNDKVALDLLLDLFEVIPEEKVFFVDYTKENIEKYIKDEDYKLIMTDEDDILYDNRFSLKGKSVCIPYVGYNFEQIEVDNGLGQVLLSKHKWEFYEKELECSIGFIEPYKLVPEMFHVG